MRPLETCLRPKAFETILLSRRLTLEFAPAEITATLLNRIAPSSKRILVDDPAVVVERRPISLSSRVTDLSKPSMCLLAAGTTHIAPAFVPLKLVIVLNPTPKLTGEVTEWI